MIGWHSQGCIARRVLGHGGDSIAGLASYSHAADPVEFGRRGAAAPLPQHLVKHDELEARFSVHVAPRARLGRVLLRDGEITDVVPAGRFYV